MNFIETYLVRNSPLAIAFGKTEQFSDHNELPTQTERTKRY